MPVGKAVHVILDNYATHKHPKVRAWLDKHPRWVFHFTPTSASWLNAVEGFFAKLTRKRLRRGSFRGGVDLRAAIHRFITEHNRTAKRLVWTADPDRIIASVNKAKKISERRNNIIRLVSNHICISQELSTKRLANQNCGS